jgi:predicted small integral membrane protein
MNLEWMAWTPVTAGFFIVIAMILIGMTIWEIRSPCLARRGFLPLTTTLGDRLFICLLGSAYIHLAWIVLTDFHVWIATVISVCFLIILMRWG